MTKEFFSRIVLLFASAKFIAWAIGMFILAKNPSLEVYTIFGPNSFVLPVAMSIVGSLGIINFWLRNKVIDVINSILFVAFWLNALYVFNLENISFYRTIPETFAIIYSMYFVVFESVNFKKMLDGFKKRHIVW